MGTWRKTLLLRPVMKVNILALEPGCPCGSEWSGQGRRWPLQDGRMGTRLQLLRPPSRNYGLGAEHKYRETSCTTLREESMAAGQVWHYRGIRGEMTGAALTGRPGIIPTLTHIINSHIRVWSPRARGGQHKTGRSIAQWGKQQWSWRQSTNHTHRPQPAISGQCRSSKWRLDRKLRRGHWTLDSKSEAITISLFFAYILNMILYPSFFLEMYFSGSAVDHVASRDFLQEVDIVCVTVDNLDTTCPPCKFTSPVEVDSAGHLSLKNCRMPPYHPAGCYGSTVIVSDLKVSKFGSSSASDAIPSRTFPIHTSSAANPSTHSMHWHMHCKKKCLFVPIPNNRK